MIEADAPEDESEDEPELPEWLVGDRVEMDTEPSVTLGGQQMQRATHGTVRMLVGAVTGSTVLGLGAGAWIVLRPASTEAALLWGAGLVTGVLLPIARTLLRDVKAALPQRLEE